jgi:hypothetical protein
MTKNSSSNFDYKLFQRILKQEIQRLEKKGGGSDENKTKSNEHRTKNHEADLGK